MNFIALISGGKDSIYTIKKLQNNGHNLIGLLYIYDISETIDSYMYQTVGKEIIHLYSECLQVPLYVYQTKAKSKNIELDYVETSDDEVEDLFLALEDIQKRTKFDAVSSGAILSNYQKNRILNICERLNIQSLTPLWNYDQKILLNEMIESGLDAFIVKIASPDLKQNVIGCNLKEIKNVIEKTKFDNYCGEGGEYESLVSYMPGFKKRIKINEFEILRHPDEEEREWNVYFMKIKKYELVNI